jgi:restriction system protein
MTVPVFQDLMLPVLRASQNGEARIGAVVERLEKELNLSDSDRTEILPSGQQTRFSNRVNWAKSYLAKAGLIKLTGRGLFIITNEGQSVLANPPKRIDIKFLEQFPDFKAFRSKSNESVSTPKDSIPASLEASSSLTPDDQMRVAQQQLQNELAADLLDRILAASPDFFERLVVQLLVAMGYGGSTADAARALGKSGDGGVDGVIDEDALGLDRIYVQAKRYTDTPVGPGPIRDFFGSLDRFKAAKGLFVTASTFTAAAKDTADLLSKRIVLIDGSRLTKLMIKHGVGCRIEEVLHIHRIDEDFFE